MGKKLDLITKTAASERRGISIPTLNYWIKKKAATGSGISTYTREGYVYVDWNEIKIFNFKMATAIKKRQLENQQSAPPPALSPITSEPKTPFTGSDENTDDDGNELNPELLRLRKLQDAEFRQKDFKARQTEMEYRKAAGELVEVAAVLQRWEALAQLLKKRIRALPARLGPVMAGEMDPRKCTILLEGELDQLLENLNEEAIEIYGGAINESGEILGEPAEVAGDNA